MFGDPVDISEGTVRIVTLEQGMFILNYSHIFFIKDILFCDDMDDMKIIENNYAKGE